MKSPDAFEDREEAGAAAELEALVQRFEHRVRYFAQRIERRYGLDPAWRDDLISAGYFGLLKALRNRRAEAHEHELSAYVSKRVEGAVLDEARQILDRASTRADFDPADLEDGIHVDLAALDWMGRGPADPEDLVDDRDRWRRIEGSFAHLEEAHRAWLLAVANGHSLAEIARHDGASPARLQNQMSRITRSVRAHTPELRRLLRREI
ncbi:MAG: sigma-70 family RNA polymerase sigma factor [Myxococcota bacterium]